MEKYDIAVIGAGITGLTSAFHLKKDNPDLKVVVIDKAGSYAQGNTGRATAGFRDLFSSQVNYALASSSIAFYKHAQESEGHDMGMRFLGYMFLLNEEESHMDVLEDLSRMTTTSRMSREELSEIGALRLSPSAEESRLLKIDPVASAFIGKNCGILEPDLVSSYYFDRLREMGVEFMFSTTVLKLNIVPSSPLDYPGEPFLWQDKKIGSIATSHGELNADTYVLATDVWTNAILDPVGIDSHMRPRKRQVFQVGGSWVEQMLGEFSVNGSGVFPFTVLPHYGLHFRPAPRERQLRVSAPDYYGRDFSMEEDPDADKSYYNYSIKPVFQAYFPGAETAKLMGMWAGYYSYDTIDAHPFVFGQMNIIVATGTSGSGLMKGDAIGRIVSAVYSKKEKAVLYNGLEIRAADLGAIERNVPRERFVL